MARQVIDIGSAANDGTGDTLRQAAQKINETLLELYLKFGDSDNLSPVISFVTGGIEFNLGTKFLLTTLAPPTTDQTILLDDATGTITLNEASQTLLQKTITLPVINSPTIGGTISDSNSNEMIILNPTGSAVNEFTFTNAATGNPPTLGATGTDTNINLNLIGKGAGSVQLGKAAFSAIEITSDGAASATASYIICNKGSALALSLADGTTTGEFKIFTNKGAGTATITPTSFAQGSSFAIPQYAAAQAIWDGTDWYLLGVDSDIAIS